MTQIDSPVLDSPRPLPGPPIATEAWRTSSTQPETTPALLHPTEVVSRTQVPPSLSIAGPVDALPAAPHGSPPPPDPTVEASMAAVWPLKLIYWPPGGESQSLIVMQSRNGPCSLISLCNVLILRGEITIYPRNRRSVSYEYLASLIADFLVSRMSDDMAFEGLSAALSKLPDLQDGMNINSVWSSHSSFKQLGEGGELKLFHLCGVPLVHGWLADPHSPEYDALLKVEDYDGAVNLIVAADDLTKGRLVESEKFISGSTEETLNLTEEQIQTVKDAVAIRQFLEANSSQLTYNGLFHLSATLQPGLYSFFRNSHLSVLYKTESSDHPLFQLVTDSAFAQENAVVWETLEDVDGSASMFVDASLIKSSTAGGDYSGRSADAALRDAEQAMGGLEIDGDLALAQQLQAEEDSITRERRRAARAAQEQQAESQAPPAGLAPGQADGQQKEQSRRRVPSNNSASEPSKKRKDDCRIM